MTVEAEDWPLIATATTAIRSGLPLPQLSDPMHLAYAYMRAAATCTSDELDSVFGCVARLRTDMPGTGSPEFDLADQDTRLIAALVIDAVAMRVSEFRTLDDPLALRVIDLVVTAAGTTGAGLSQVVRREPVLEGIRLAYNNPPQGFETLFDHYMELVDAAEGALRPAIFIHAAPTTGPSSARGWQLAFGTTHSFTEDGVAGPAEDGGGTLLIS